LAPETAARGGMNPKMFNSFIDGTKSGIEMTAVCNATGLVPQPDGLSFPPSSVYDLARVCKPASAGGRLAITGTTEVVSSLNRDMSPVANHLQMGTYVVVKAGHDYVRHCAEEYHFLPDDNYEHMALYRPTHMIGLELGISVACVALRREPTGAATGFQAQPPPGRDARRRGRLLRVGQADPGGALARRGASAARACPQCRAQAQYRGGRAAQVGGCRVRPH
jgi:predicted homoserine dehydrogenase-like protein